ncbi:MAG: GspE/PulE family protein [Clostridium sp.]
MFNSMYNSFDKKTNNSDKVSLCNSLDEVKVDRSIINLIPRSICIKNNMLPIKLCRESRTITILTTYPIMEIGCDDIKFISGYEPVFLHYSNSEGLKDFINKNLMDYIDIKDANEIESSYVNGNMESGDSPAKKIVDNIFNEAFNLNASDVHVEPFKAYYRVRYRVDGELREGLRLSRTSYSAIISRIKVISKIDISEKRLPLDGRISISAKGILWDLRVSTIPTINGEKLVIRIFQEKTKIKGLNDIGLINENLNIIQNFLKLKSGIVLISGPTGSGKSTTLYTMLRQLDMDKRNIITIEDPVEQRIEGITQINVNSQIGFDFAKGLRSILRQDPDIIMIGEIRDSHTASIAMRAAITGHLVFSTIHTQDSLSVLDRLLDMGIEHYMISSGLTGVISQRLLRKVCSDCSVEYIPSEYEINILNIASKASLKIGKGCEACGYTGYSGRVGVFETLKIGDTYKKALGANIGSSAINDDCFKNNHISLKTSAIDLLLRGITSTKEVLNII